MRLGHVVIVGGGLAGLRAAERLRERGFSGSLTMISEEPRAPYNRTPLSKALLLGKTRVSDLEFQTFTRLSMSMRLGQRAVQLHPDRQTVELESGDAVPYDGLIIATGVGARVPASIPMHAGRIVTLRSLDDFDALAPILRTAKRLAVVGGGFLGCEVAASARRLGVGVTIIDLAPSLIHHVLGSQVGAVLGDIHRDGGVQLRFGVSVEWCNARADGVGLDLSDGSSVDADVVLVSIGSEPRARWLEGTAVDTSDGVLCDPTSHVVGVDNVVAAGDIARWPNIRFGPEARRVEHWINAVEHGRAAADSLLDGRERAAAFTPVPRFWSEQFGVRMQSVGMPALASRLQLVQGSVDRRTFVVACMRGDRIVGAIGFDSPRAMVEFAEIIEAANPVPTLAPARVG